MHLPDLHPILSLLLAGFCAFVSWLAGALAATFWRYDSWQRADTVPSCRLLAVFAGLLCASFGLMAFGYLLGAFARIVNALYAWGVL